MDKYEKFKQTERTSNAKLRGKKINGQVIDKITCRGSSANVIYDFHNKDGEIFYSDMGYRKILKKVED